MYFNKNRYFHVTNLNVRVRPTHPFASIWRNCGEIWYMSDPKSNWPSFCLILKLSHALDGLSVWCLCSMYYLGCMVININALFAEWSITEYDYFQCCLGFFTAFDGHFPGFGKTHIPSASDLHCFGSVCWLYWGLLFI